MNLIAFYRPDPKSPMKHFLGTLHIELKDLGIQIRGITVQCRKGKWRFDLPAKNVISDGKRVRYPTIDFNNKVIKQMLYDVLMEKAPPFIEEQLKKLPPYVEPAKKKKFFKNKFQNKPFKPRNRDHNI